MFANIWADHCWSSGGGEGEWVVGPEAPAWELGLSAACSNLIVVFELYFFTYLSLLSDLRVCLYSWLLRMFDIGVCDLLHFQWNENKLCQILAY